MPHYSRDDAISERELEILLREARQLEPPYNIQARFIIVCCGRLGMRSGEVAHFRSSWVNKAERIIRIPQQEDCDFGKGGEVCGYCRNRARDYMETHNKSTDERVTEILSQYPSVERDTAFEMAENEEHNISFEEALSMRWTPKNEPSFSCYSI